MRKTGKTYVIKCGRLIDGQSAGMGSKQLSKPA
jgi:hypothetical protein